MSKIKKDKAAIVFEELVEAFKADANISESVAIDYAGKRYTFRNGEVNIEDWKSEFEKYNCDLVVVDEGYISDWFYEFGSLPFVMEFAAAKVGGKFEPLTTWAFGFWK